MVDATAKGRMKVEGKTHYGADNKSSKLNPDKVKEIRLLLKTGVTYTEIAKRYGVDRGVVTQIRTGQTWKAVI